MKRTHTNRRITAFLVWLWMLVLALPVRAQGTVTATEPEPTPQDDGTTHYAVDVMVPLDYAAGASELAFELPDGVKITSIRFRTDEMPVTITVGPKVDPADGLTYVGAITGKDNMTGTLTASLVFQATVGPDDTVTVYMREAMYASMAQAADPTNHPPTRLKEDLPIVLAGPTTEPTDPTEPSDPTDPSDPTPTPVPDDPTPTSVPSEPTEPSDPTDPTDPTPTPVPDDPTPTSVPSAPTDPSDPTDPIVPIEPTIPTEPTSPSDTPEPTEPTGTDESTAPTDEPTDPTATDEPTEPTDEPTDPTVTDEPTVPEDTDAPTDPAAPTDPEGHDEPTDPTDSDGASEDDTTEHPPTGERRTGHIVWALILIAAGLTGVWVVYRRKKRA